MRLALYLTGYTDDTQNYRKSIFVLSETGPDPEEKKISRIRQYSGMRELDTYLFQTSIICGMNIDRLF